MSLQHLWTRLYQALTSKGDRQAHLSLLVYYVLSVAWGLWSISTWDDDCATRYFHTLNAFNDPREFISLWNRPLWVLIFALPVLLGKFVIPVIMSGINCVTAYSLYQYAKAKQLSNGWLLVPFLLFQPFFFGVGRDAMTEPLAACLIALGLLFWVRKHFWPFALVGALLPLARLELTLLLPLWGLVLVQEKKWKPILLLVSGLAALAMATSVVNGTTNFFAFFEALFDGEQQENRYGHKPFYTYLHRYFYVLGPTVFFFLIFGIYDRIKKRSQSQWLIDGQFILGFALYTLFAWKLNVGSSAGFLRNLLPLSPLAAIVALYGFNFWHKAVKERRKDAKILSVLVAGAVLVFFRNEILEHHQIGEKVDWWSLLLLSIPLLLTWFGNTRLIASIFNSETQSKLAVLITGLIVLHTLVSEPPDASYTSERKAMARMSAFYENSTLNRYPTYVSHNWFYWSGDYVPNTHQFSELTAHSLENAPDSSIFIWDTHYGNKTIAQGVFIANSSDYLELFRLSATDHLFTSVVYQKLPQHHSNAIQVFEPLIQQHPEFAQLYTGRGLCHLKYGEFESAESDLQLATANSGVQPYDFLSYGNLAMAQNDFTKAAAMYAKAAALNPNSISAIVGVGNAHMNNGQLALAVEDYSKAIKLNPDYTRAILNRGLCYLDLNQRQKGCADLTIAYNQGNAEALKFLNSYCR